MACFDNKTEVCAGEKERKRERVRERESKRERGGEKKQNDSSNLDFGVVPFSQSK